MIQNTKPIESVEDYLKDIPSDAMLQRRVVYRGQSKDEPLVPSLFREGHACAVEGYDWFSYERTILRLFKAAGIPALLHKPDNDTDWIVLAQHHGVPTRILDWSSNALHALYFSVENCDESTDGVVWRGEFTRIRTKEYSMEELSSINNVELYFPNHQDRRITAQSGCVTFHPLPKENSEFDPFVPKSGLDLVPMKYIIPGKIKESILFRLDDLGVNAHSIYPDLDGLGSYIKHRIRRRLTVDTKFTFKREIDPLGAAGDNVAT